MPADVCIPDGLTGLAVEQFDHYSWRAFVALVWPAETGRRGVAAAAKGIAASGPRVFETFKSLSEVFHPDGSAPEPAFDKYDAAASNPCGVSPAFGDLVIGSHSGIDDIGQAGIGDLDGPLVAQNGRYVRTLTSFQPNPVRSHRQQPILPERASCRPCPALGQTRPVIEFPDRIDRREVRVGRRRPGCPAALVERLYTRPALVKSATGGGCTKTTVGLIGTAHRPEDAEPAAMDLVVVRTARHGAAEVGGLAGASYVLNDNSGAPMPTRNPLSLAPLAPEPVRPFNVVRHGDGADSDANRTDELRVSGPARRDAVAVLPAGGHAVAAGRGEPGLADSRGLWRAASPIRFLATGAFSAFTNVTMETFDQHAVQLGCMSCHNRARMTADFMWTLVDHAYPARLRPAASSGAGASMAR